MSVNYGLVFGVVHIPTDSSIIFSDRLEIQNPGMLPFGMTLDDMKSGVSKIRNPVIARVLRELDYMEKWGTGYKRIIEDCDDGGYPHPEWQELSMVMRVKFQPTQIPAEKIKHDVPVNVPVNERQKWFLDHLELGLRVKAKAINEKFDVSLKTARRDIKYLMDNDIIVFSGSPKTGFYKLSLKMDKTLEEL
jgi:ATP-dependent DNA helicase RecG